MSQPQNYQNMYYIEGQTTAVLVTTRGGKRTMLEVQYSTPGRALSWCRKHRAGFIYQPTVPNN